MGERIPWQPFRKNDGLVGDPREERVRHRPISELLAEILPELKSFREQLKVNEVDFEAIFVLNAKFPVYVRAILKFARENNCSFYEAQYNTEIPSEVLVYVEQTKHAIAFDGMTFGQVSDLRRQMWGEAE